MLFNSPIALTREHHGEVVWPGEQPVLLPPPLGDERDVEAEEEGDVARVGAWAWGDIHN